jgi:BON domain/AraC-binding-like domain
VLTSTADAEQVRQLGNGSLKPGHAAVLQATTMTTSDVDEAREILGGDFYSNFIDVLPPIRPWTTRIDVAPAGPVTIGDLRFGTDVRINFGELGAYHVDLPLSRSLAWRQGRCKVTVPTSAVAAVFQPVGDTVLEHWRGDRRLLSVACPACPTCLPRPTAAVDWQSCHSRPSARGTYPATGEPDSSLPARLWPCADRIARLSQPPPKNNKTGELKENQHGKDSDHHADRRGRAARCPARAEVGRPAIAERDRSRRQERRGDLNRSGGQLPQEVGRGAGGLTCSRGRGRGQRDRGAAARLRGIQRQGHRGIGGPRAGARHADPHGHGQRSPVSGGWVTLRGAVEWDYQRREAERVVRTLAGVKGVTNLIDLRPRKGPIPEELTKQIEEALVRKAETDGEKITVTVWSTR